MGFSFQYWPTCICHLKHVPVPKSNPPEDRKEGAEPASSEEFEALVLDLLGLSVRWLCSGFRGLDSKRAVSFKDIVH